MHPMNLLLPCLDSWTFLFTVGHLVMPWNALWWVIWARKDAFIILFMPCSVFSAKSESVYETCYVYMGAIISSLPFWLVISKGLLFYKISGFMPCLWLPWYVPVACCLIALNLCNLMLFLSCPVISAKSVNCYYLQSFHVLLSMFYWFLEIAQCSCFVMPYMYIMSMFFFHVELL